MYRIRSFDGTPLKITEPSAFFLAEKTYNKDLEIPPYRLHPNFCFAKTSLNPDVIRNIPQNQLRLKLDCKIDY